MKHIKEKVLEILRSDVGNFNCLSDKALDKCVITISDDELIVQSDMITAKFTIQLLNNGKLISKS